MGQSSSYLEPAELFLAPIKSTPDILFECSSGLSPKQFDGLPDFLYHRVSCKEHQSNWWRPDMILLYAGGACPLNGKQGARGGCGIVWHKPFPSNPNAGTLSFRLEEYGPSGKKYAPTNQRAELRAAIAALQLCDWPETRIKTIVIATDSAYVVDGAMDFCTRWFHNGWQRSKGGPIVNQDLWTSLLQLVADFKHQGVTVFLWHIPQKLNKKADSLAKKGANLPGHPRYEPHPVLQELWDADRNRTADRAASFAALAKPVKTAANKVDKPCVHEAVVEELSDADKAAERVAFLAAVNNAVKIAVNKTAVNIIAIGKAPADETEFREALNETMFNLIEDGHPLGYWLTAIGPQTQIILSRTAWGDTDTWEFHG
ncbi:hypothetical protein MBLNU457_1782t1 [Dothideomycetes sp. NU457]